MAKHSHEFVENYDGLGAFGWDRKTDEETVMFYLQKFSDDEFLKVLIKRLSDDELAGIYERINELMKKHLTEEEYHNLFLKEEHHH